MAVLSIAVVSDLHVHSEAPSPDAPSHLGVADPDDQPKRHPIAGLTKLIADENLKADLLLNAGDSTNKADPVSLKYAWGKLQDLGRILGASRVVATAGNHDMDSRYEYNDFDAKGYIQSLLPPFPGLDENLCDRYWAKNFVIFCGGNYRILLLNSAAYHGGAKSPEDEIHHGRVSKNTLNLIEQELSKTDPKPVNILLCHHHLMRDTAIAEADYSEMSGGDVLLDTLASGKYGQWVVVHGHKHHPRLFYGHGPSASSPIIFGAGSLSAKLYPELSSRARNQFHIIRLPVSNFDALGVEVAGVIASWDWIPLKGWQRAGRESGLPHKAGFGYRSNLINEVRKIETIVRGTPPYVEWDAILTELPQLAYILPEDEAVLLRKLKDKKINLARDDDGNIIQLSAQ